MFLVETSDREILECGTGKTALRMSFVRSGRSLFAVADECGMSESHLSRCLNVNDTLSLNHDKLVQFMVSCNNAIYLRWLYLKLKESMPELEEDRGNVALIEMVGGCMQELKDVLAEIRLAKRPERCSCCGHLALLPSEVNVPRWLHEAAALIVLEMDQEKMEAL